MPTQRLDALALEVIQCALGRLTPDDLMLVNHGLLSFRDLKEVAEAYLGRTTPEMSANHSSALRHSKPPGGKRSIGARSELTAQSLGCDRR